MIMTKQFMKRWVLKFLKYALIASVCGCAAVFLLYIMFCAKDYAIYLGGLIFAIGIGMVTYGETKKDVGL